MILNRRQFSKLTIAGSIGAALPSAFFLGCNSTTALAEVERFQPVLTNVLNLACTISSGLPICGTMLTTIQSDYALVLQLWGQYLSAVKAGTSTVAIWNELNAAFTTFEANAAAIFAAAGTIQSPELQAIVAAAEVLLAAIEALFPAPPAGANGIRSAKFSAHGLGQPRATYNRAWFESWATDYNQKVDMAKKRYPGANLAKVHLKFTR